MTKPILIYNPSPYSRGGHVLTPWAPISAATGIPRDEFLIRDAAGQPRPAQVVRVDPTDPSRDLLVFTLGAEVGGGDEHYQTPSGHVTVERGSPAAGPAGPCDVYTDGLKMFKLDNGRLEASFSLAPEPWENGRNWFAGAAYGVQLEHKEMLDAFALGWEGHDEEKRCMQVDYIELSRPAWDWEPEQRVRLFDRPYRVLHESQARGPVWAGVTIASEPFDYTFHDPFTQQTRRLRCELHRSFGLPSGANFILEHLFVKALPDGGEPQVELCFKAHYFAHMEMGRELAIHRHESVPDWFAVCCAFFPFQGYGFATDVHASPVFNPHPGYPNPEEQESRKTFSWWTLPSKETRCLHLFWHNGLKMQKPPRPESQAGHAWYEFIYKPLRAAV